MSPYQDHLPGQTRMLVEAGEAAAAIARQPESAGSELAALARQLHSRQPGLVLTLGRGSSDHAATYAKYLIETRLGVPVASVAPSIGSVYRKQLRVSGALCLVISQSGKSPDLIAAAERLRSSGALIVALVNCENAPIARFADIVLPLAAGQETSVAATKSFLASLAMTLRIVSAWSADKAIEADLETLPGLLEQAWSLDWSKAGETLAGHSQLFVVGRGLSLGAAQEAALKFKETCRLHGEAYSAAEILHGPAAMIDTGFPILVFSQNDEAKPGLQQVVDRLSSLGAKVLLSGDSRGSTVSLPAIDAPAYLQPLLQIQSFYRMVNSLSLRLGVNPDSPPHISKVTETV